MTFDELLNEENPTVWESTTDQQLDAILRPFFLVTRPTKKPEVAAREAKEATRKPGGRAFADLQKELFTLAAQNGIKLPDRPSK